MTFRSAADYRIAQYQSVRTAGKAVRVITGVSFYFIKKDSGGGGKMPAGRKPADCDLIRFDFPFRGAGADDLYCSKRIFLRGRKTIWRDPVLHDKCVESQRVELFGNSHAFMRRTGALAASGTDQNRAKRFFSLQQMYFHKRLKVILLPARSSAFAVMPQHNILCNAHNIYP